MSKSSGFVSGLAKLGLVESDAPPPLPHVEAAPQPAMAMPYQPMATTVSLTDQDQQRMAAIQAQVYAAPSSYVIFRDVSQSLGNPLDPDKVFAVLKVANPSVTRAKVLADIDMHLGIIASTHQDFESQLQQARSGRIDGPTQQIAALVQQNQQAAADIQARTNQITQLQQSVTEAQKSVSDGEQRFKLIEDQLNAPLLQARAILGGKK